MSHCPHRLPGFKTTCVGIGALYVLLGGSIVLRGAAAALAPFRVPEAILSSPHYADAILWVYSHMVVIGLTLIVLGRFARGARLKLAAARLFCVAHAYYAYLDFRASDSVVGNALYHGPVSLAPAFISLVGFVLFAHLSWCSRATYEERELLDG
jgi:hypothetical protein